MSRQGEPVPSTERSHDRGAELTSQQAQTESAASAQSWLCGNLAGGSHPKPTHRKFWLAEAGLVSLERMAALWGGTEQRGAGTLQWSCRGLPLPRVPLLPRRQEQVLKFVVGLKELELRKKNGNKYLELQAKLRVAQKLQVQNFEAVTSQIRAKSRGLPNISLLVFSYLCNNT